MGLKLLKFSADWCAPCKALDKELDKIHSDVVLVRVDIEEDTGATQLHAVRSVPTLILVDNDGHEIGRLTGKKTAAQIEEFLQNAV